MLTDSFDKIVCSHYAPANRWGDMLSVIKDHDKLIRVNCVEADDKFLSAALTARELLRWASMHEQALVIEEDLIFIDGYEDIWHEAKYSVPDDWEMIFFGANLTEKAERIDKYWVKLNGCWMGHCFAVNSKSAKKILAYMEDNELMGDVVFNQMQQKGLINAYLITPMIAYQRPGYSNLVEKVVDYKQAMEYNFKRFVK